MHIAFFTIPTVGHVYPTLAVVAELVRRGHRVTYPSTGQRAPDIEEQGATVVPVSFLADAEATVGRLERAYSDDRPDLVVVDRMAVAGRVVAAAWHVPAVQSWSYRVGYPPVRDGLPAPKKHLAYFPRAFQSADSADVLGDEYCFVGPCIRQQSAAGWQPPAGDGPLVLISSAVDASGFAGTDWRVVVASGVPQLRVLAHAAVYVGHGGMGGIMEALSYGRPVVAVPRSPEQQANAARLTELGLGTALGPADLTPAALRTAVDAVAKDDAVADRILQMRYELVTAGGTTRAADVIEDCLP